MYTFHLAMHERPLPGMEILWLNTSEAPVLRTVHSILCTLGEYILLAVRSTGVIFRKCRSLTLLSN